MTAEEFRALALEMPGATEHAHMNHPDFRVRGGIFASLLSGDRKGGLNLPPEEQRVFLRLHPQAFSAASGAWGRQGWTMVDLAVADAATVRGAILLACEYVAAKARRRASSTSSTSPEPRSQRKPRGET